MIASLRQRSVLWTFLGSTSSSTRTQPSTIELPVFQEPPYFVSFYWSDRHRTETRPNTEKCRLQTPALIWFGGSGLPRWVPTVGPNSLAACSSWNSGFSWKPFSLSKQSIDVKARGSSPRTPSSRLRQPSSMVLRTSGGTWEGAQKIWGARTWKPQ